MSLFDFGKDISKSIEKEKSEIIGFIKNT